MPIAWYQPTPAPPAALGGVTASVFHGSWVSRLLFMWVTPLLRVGYSRPLEHEGQLLLDCERPV